MALDTDPRDLKLDRQNDLVITTDLQWTRGVDAVMQDCRIVLQMFQGEWFLNRAAGIPYWGRILRERPDVAQRAAREIFYDKLRNVESVVEVLLLDVQYIGALRTLTVRWKVRCEFGDTPVDTVNINVG